MRRSAFSMIFLACAIAPGSGVLAGSGLDRIPTRDALRDREPLPKQLDLTAPRFEHRLVVKFVDHARVRLQEGVLVSTMGLDLAPVDRVATDKHVVVSYRPVVRTPDALVEALEQRAARNTGVEPIDLRGMYVVDAPVERLEEIGEALARLDLVEWVEFEMLRPEPPACADIAPSSGDLHFLQGYFDGASGMNVDAARLSLDSRGAGVNIADVEYGCNPDHEDLCSIIMEPGQTIAQFVYDNGWDSHGTSVAGILNAGDNGYGVEGIAPDAQYSFFPEWSTEQGGRRPTAILNAAATMDAGDIIVLEMQTIVYGNNYGPAELNSSVWSAVKTATDAGLVVIGAAGNGNQNLDSRTYEPYSLRGDSGAILVGAGSNTASPNKLSFSTYGNRVNVQGWGTGVASTGYGSYTTYGADKNQRYTSSFNGTSSATPTVAGVAAIAQGYARARYGVTLTSTEMRTLLIDTGKAQTSGGHIGPRADAGAAIGMIDETYGAYCDADINRSGDVDIVDFSLFAPAFDTSVGDGGFDERADLNGTGTVDIIDFAMFAAQFGDSSETCHP